MSNPVQNKTQYNEGIKSSFVDTQSPYIEEGVAGQVSGAVVSDGAMLIDDRNEIRKIESENQQPNSIRSKEESSPTVKSRKAGSKEASPQSNLDRNRPNDIDTAKDKKKSSNARASFQSSTKTPKSILSSQVTRIGEKSKRRNVSMH